VKPASILIAFVLVMFIVVVSKAEGSSTPPGQDGATSVSRTTAAAQPPAPPPADAANPLSVNGRFADVTAIVASLVAIALAALAVFAVPRRR
jgi:hypothetical protein